jgi:hypothetical protein
VRPSDYLRLILGTHPTQGGWILLGFGMVFVWAFSTKADYAGVVRFSGPLDTAAGEVVGIREGFGTENESEVLAYEYRFTGPDGRDYTGVSYSARRRLRIGDKVAVEFPRGDPGVSRIVGMSRGAAPVWAGAVAVVCPLFGLWFLGLGYVRARRARRLLTTGQLATATVTGKTEVPNGDGVLVEWAFTFAAFDGRESTLKHRTEPSGLFEEGVGYPVAYDPSNPADAVLLAALPGRPRVGEGGDIAFPEAESWRSLLLFPVLTIVGHGVHAVLRFAF